MFTCLFSLFVSGIYSVSAKRSEAASKITVTNTTSATVEVSINKWGVGGVTSYYKIAPNKSESWGRSDSRGFILSVRRSTRAEQYYVKAGEVLYVENYNTAKDSGLTHYGIYRKNESNIVAPSGSNKITFVNKINKVLYASANTWKGGITERTTNFTVKSGKSEVWTRSDGRGFVMYIKDQTYLAGLANPNPVQQTIFVKPGQTVTCTTSTIHSFPCTLSVK